jgi:hypothetical protein
MDLSQISLIVIGLIFVLLGLSIRLALLVRFYRHVYAYNAFSQGWARIAAFFSVLGIIFVVIGISLRIIAILNLGMDLSQISLIISGLIFVLIGLGIRLAILLIVHRRRPVFYGGYEGQEKLYRSLKIAFWISIAVLLVGVGQLILGYITFVFK